MTEKTIPEPESKYDDSRRPPLAAARLGAITFAVITMLPLLVWGSKNNMPGAWGILLGAGISGNFVLLTVLSILFTARTLSSVTLAIALDDWLLKIVVPIGVLAVIGDLGFCDDMTFFVAVVLALMMTLGTEVWGMSQSNLTYVQPMKDE